MSRIAVVGALWGDEGKGKIVDFLSESFELVVRFQGGDNAGHTIFEENHKKIVLHVVPSGILRTKALIAHGVVIDPIKLVNELENLKSVKSDFDLKISGNAVIVTPYHQLLDSLRDKHLNIGTTGRGIGPAYEDLMRRVSLKIKDLTTSNLGGLLEKSIYEKEFLIKNFYHQDMPNFSDIKKRLEAAGKELLPYIVNDFDYLNKFENILYEGAQGILLDINYGTYPYVTASNTIPAGIFSGAHMTNLDEVIGVTKIYTTRVGHGPMPTEDVEAFGNFLQTKGKEFGSTTGRPRRCGYLDLPLLRYSIKTAGITALALTKVDIMQGQPLKVCYAYKWQEKEYTTYNSLMNLEEVKPLYHDLSSFNNIDSQEFKSFLDYLERELQIRIKIITFGEHRDSIKVLED